MSEEKEVDVSAALKLAAAASDNPKEVPYQDPAANNGSYAVATTSSGLAGIVLPNGSVYVGP